MQQGSSSAREDSKLPACVNDKYAHRLVEFCSSDCVNVGCPYSIADRRTLTCVISVANTRSITSLRNPAPAHLLHICGQHQINHIPAQPSPCSPASYLWPTPDQSHPCATHPLLTCFISVANTRSITSLRSSALVCEQGEQQHTKRRHWPEQRTHAADNGCTVPHRQAIQGAKRAAYGVPSRQAVARCSYLVPFCQACT